MNNANPIYNNHSQYDNAQFNQSATGNPQDLSLAFGSLSNLNPSNLDYGQFSNASQLQQRFSGDATSRHPSPGFQHPGAYQTNPVIPAKRARAGNDLASASPRPAPGLLNAQRSQTPQQQQAHNSYGTSVNNNYQRPPNAFPHMQNATHNQPSPSPAPSNPPYNPQVGPSQRNPTSSPHQFGAQNSYNASQGPGAGSNMNGVTGTPQMMRGMQPGQGFNQNPSGLAQATGQYNGMQGQQGQLQNGQGQDSQTASQYQQQQQYKMKLQQAQQQLLNNNVVGQNRLLVGNTFPNAGGAAPGTPVTNGLSLGRLPQQASQVAPATMSMPNIPNMPNMPNISNMNLPNAQASEQSFLGRLKAFAQQQGQNLDPQPTVCGRPVNYHHIFSAVTNSKILAPGSTYNNWTIVANALGFSPGDYPTAAQETEAIFNQNLKGFVTTWMSIMNKRRIQLQQQQQQQQQMGARPNMQMSPPSNNHSADLPVSSPTVQPFQQPPPQPNTRTTPAARKSSLPPPMHQMQSDIGHMMPNINLDHLDHRQPSLPRTQSITADTFSPPFARKQSSIHVPITSATAQLSDMYSTNSELTNIKKEDKKPRGPVHVPKIRSVDTYGGLGLEQLFEVSEELHKVKPGLPIFEEMGLVDINALSLGIQSGMHSEMRYALDQLLSLSADPRYPLSLIDCEELVDTLIDCAEDQLDYLANEATEESDEIQLPYLEDLAVAAQWESLAVQDRPSFASKDYERKQAAERLTGITAILRNISFADSAANHNLLAGPSLIVMLSTTVRLLGTRSMLLHSHHIAVDFMKDAVTLLSNIAHRVELPGKEEALAIMHLLVAFAPAPHPDSQSSSNKLSFAFYDPTLHQYLPSAVDALAKLIARDEPNRSFIRQIFQSESTLPAASQLLTRAFSLSIAPIPDRNKGHLIGPMEFRLAEARKPFLCQGMLAADILTSLLPSIVDVNTPNLAQAWLGSDDGWTRSLMHMVLALSMDPAINGAPMRHPSTQRIMDPEGRGFALVTRKALSMLRRLAIKAREGKSLTNGHVLEQEEKGVLFKLGSETIVQALCNPMLDPETLRWLLDCAGMEEA